jgi:hypothetical protein
MEVDISFKMYSEAGEETQGLQYCYTEITTEGVTGVEIDLKKLMTFPGSDKLRIVLERMEEW